MLIIPECQLALLAAMFYEYSTAKCSFYITNRDSVALKPS